MTMNRRAMIALAARDGGKPRAGAGNGDRTRSARSEGLQSGQRRCAVKIVEYASFTCPHCANFHTDVFKQLKAEYIDTGKVHFTLREVYFDRYGLWAAMMARCGGEMKYFPITDILFSTQVNGPERMIRRWP